MYPTSEKAQEATPPENERKLVEIAKALEAVKLAEKLPDAYVVDGEVFTIYHNYKVVGAGPGAKVELHMDRILMGRAVGYVSEVTVAKYFYDLCRQFGVEEAKARIEALRRTRCIFIPPDSEIATQAALLLCRHGDKISLADAFLIATAKAKGATILTANKAIAEVGGVDVIYVGAGA